MSLILTRPTGTGGSVPGTYEQNITVPAELSKLVDILEIQNSTTIKWLVTIMDDVNNRMSSCEVLAGYKKGSNDPSFTRYGTIGDRIHYAVSVTYQDGNLSLQLINNESTDLTVSIVRIQTIT